MPGKHAAHPGRAHPPVRRRLWIGVAIAIPVIFLAIAAWIVVALVSAGREALRAEDRFQAVVLVCDLAGEFAEHNAGRAWPGSWKDLEQLPAREWGPLTWPKDSGRVSVLVNVDFTVSIDQVLAMNPREFVAIRPGPGRVQVPAAGYYEMLQNRIRAARERNSPKGG
ncbi:MAG: hypothetical protein IT436_18130 [Phycisphaerales bacterium]|nr:hypothetical protein [Phycisphaerales bacterium]